MVRIQSLAQELLHATGAAKKKKKERRKRYTDDRYRYGDRHIHTNTGKWQNRVRVPLSFDGLVLKALMCH